MILQMARLTVSTFELLSQRGMEASLWRHLVMGSTVNGEQYKE